MKSISGGFEAHLALPTTTLAACLTVTRTDGVVIYATSHDQDLTIDGNVYLARAGGTATDVASNMALNVDNSDLHGLLDLDAISERDLRAGLYDYAAVSKFLVNYADLTQGRYRVQDGTLGQVTVDRLTFVAELRGLMQALQQSFGRICTPSCAYTLGDADCTKDLTAFTVTGTLDSVSVDQLTLNDSARTEAGPVAATDTTPGVSGYFDYGLITITSGDNDGISREVKLYDVGTWTLQEPFPFTLAGTESYTMIAGDDKLATTCRVKFDNLLNFGGFPFVPGIDSAMEVGHAE